jgi:hypothetical protein
MSSNGSAFTFSFILMTVASFLRYVLSLLILSNWKPAGTSIVVLYPTLTVLLEP